MIMLLTFGIKGKKPIMAVYTPNKNHSTTNEGTYAKRFIPQNLAG